MDPQTDRPATLPGGEPIYVIARAADKKEISQRPAGVQWLCFKLELEGATLRVTGRSAQTLGLLLKVGPAGFTSGEASPLHWARRTSHYIRELRLLGVAIVTLREPAGDAVIGRYVLAGRVIVVAHGEDSSC